MDTRREFLKKATMLSGGAGLFNMLSPSIARALAIDPAAGTSFMDAEHVVFLMQENRSFDHTFGTLQGVRGYNDPRAISLPDRNPVWLQSNSKGETFAPFRLDIKNTKATWMSSLPHGWADQVDARNEGKYDKWLDSKASGHDEYKGMPLTLGYHNREDIPFYYSLADAFTVCDQHFCSSLTGTTPNRLYFWSGTIREKPDPTVMARVWNDDADYDTPVSWKTFPERLEENGIPWKVYQNELSVNTGLSEEEANWLGNFTDNPLEFFTQYNVRLSKEYMAALKDEAQKKLYNNEQYAKLSPLEKNLHAKAFVNNRRDPAYHELSGLTYSENGTEREVKIPKGDLLYQFREDVKNGVLPTVSWLVAPANFSDHPTSAWYGAWYISEVMDILTQNPEIWKKTVFVLTYDENDGYFDHVPPFVAPDPSRKETGFTSKGINTAVDYVAGVEQQTIKDKVRQRSIGLGYRVPMVIASPWTRGGWVNSQVFDHTSSLMFLEKFLSKKTGKKIEESNISTWRRSISGDLTSVFRPYNGEAIKLPKSLERNSFIEGIHKAQFKGAPTNYKSLSEAEKELARKNPARASFLPKQEKGTRDSSALPYELYADGRLSMDKKNYEISMKCGNRVFATAAAGSPFNVYAPGVFRGENVKTWAYAVEAGEDITASWQLGDFANNIYHLMIYGPNGFFREFTGTKDDPAIDILCVYDRSTLQPELLTGNLVVQVVNREDHSQVIELTDNAYKTSNRNIVLDPAGGQRASQSQVLNLSGSFGWYDFTISLKGNALFRKRYAGRVETGKHSKTDPFMGRSI
ncbi:MAG TPA: phospholipase C, phosphocholine-specific [Flavitalea sp.]|nr:phospholipase C, phosphocholine-specific [Flavitalea sp.]